MITSKPYLWTRERLQSKKVLRTTNTHLGKDIYAPSVHKSKDFISSKTCSFLFLKGPFCKNPSSNKKRCA